MRALILERRHHRQNTFSYAATRLKTENKKQLFVQTEKRREREERNSFISAEEEREESFEFFFSDVQRKQQRQERGEEGDVTVDDF